MPHIVANNTDIACVIGTLLFASRRSEIGSLLKAYSQHTEHSPLTIRDFLLTRPFIVSAEKNHKIRPTEVTYDIVMMLSLTTYHQ